MKPAPLNPQTPSPWAEDDYERLPATVRAVYWIDMRNKQEGGEPTGWRDEYTEIICAEPPTRTGEIVAGWMTQTNGPEDSYWAGRNNVIVAGIRVDSLEFGS